MRELYTGTLENYFDMMERMAWRIPAGSTSNCSTHYDIGAVAMTSNDTPICIIFSKHDKRCFVTPVRTYADGTSYSNYGTPTVDLRAVDAVEKFNHDIIDSRQYGCKLGTIRKMIVKDGRIFEFDVELGVLDKVIKTDGQVIDLNV